MVFSLFFQFYRDAKDTQDLLKKVDTDLDLKFNPDFKDRYQVEAQLRELEVGTNQGLAGFPMKLETAYGVPMV